MVRPLDFSVQFTTTIQKWGRTYDLKCTAELAYEGETPVLLWCERAGTGFYHVPEEVWEAVEYELEHGGPARDAYAAQVARMDELRLSA